MNTIIVKTNDATQTVAQVQVVTKDGKPTIIKAMDKVNYEFHDAAIGRAPNHIITKRLKNDLHISFEEDGKESDLIIEGFYDEADSALLGIAEDGEYYYYIPDTGETYDYVTQLETGDVEGQALGGTEYIAAAIPWWIPAAAGLGLAGLVVGLSSGGGDDDKPIEPAAIVSLNGVTSLSEANAANEANTAVYTVSLDRASATDTTVTVTITPGSADGGDYSAPITQTVTIPAGQTSIDFSVPIVNDDVYEGVESFTVAITSVTAGRATINSSKDTVDTIIYDNGTTDGTTPIDPNNPTTGSDIPVVKIIATDGQAMEGVDNGLVFTISQNKISNFDTLVDVKLSDTSSIELADIASINYVGIDDVTVFLSNANDIQNFLTNGASVKIPAGQSSAPAINVTVVNDAIYEQSESLVLEIVISTNSPTPAAINIDSATGTIVDEDRVDDSGDQLGDFDDSDESQDTDQGDAVSGNLLDNATDTDPSITLNVANVQVTSNGAVITLVIGDATPITDADNNPIGSITVNADGSYNFTPDADFTGEVPVISYDIVDSAAPTDVLDSSELNITVIPGPVEIAINATKATSTEQVGSDDTLEFTITQNVASDKDSSVKVTLDGSSPNITASDIARLQYTKADGTVVNTTDQSIIANFLTDGDTVQIAAGSKTSTVIFTIADDSAYEQTENLGLVISNPVNPNGISITTNTDSGVISDESNNPANPLDGSNTEGDRPTVRIEATDAQAIEGEDNVLSYTVKQDNLSNLATTVQVKVDTVNSDVEAKDIASITYTNAAGNPVTITGSTAIQNVLNGTTVLEVKVPAGSTAAPLITVTTNNDDIYENSEQLSFVVTGADNAAIDSTVATGTIVDESDATDPGDGSNTDGDKPTAIVIGDSVTEGSALEFTVNLSNLSESDTTVALTLASGTAVLGTDTGTPVQVSLDGGNTFSTVTVAVDGTFSVDIPANSTNGIIVRVPTTDDNIDEPDETITLTASATDQVTPSTATGTIIDNDAAPIISIDGAVLVNEDAGTVTYTVSLTNPSSTAVTVDYATSNGTATAGADYVANSGTLTFAAGKVTKTVTVAITDDTLFENSENYTIALSNPSLNASIDNNNASVTTAITDNDIAPTITIENTDAATTPADNSVVEGTGNTVTGAINISNPQSVTALTINSVDVTTATTASPVIINGSEGKLVITGYNATTGALTYAYTEDGSAETHNAAGDNVLDQFIVNLTNTAGDTTSDTLDIQIIDTVPVANPDNNNITEETDKVSGNVLTAFGAAATDIADNLGADTPTLVNAVEAVTSGIVAGVVGGKTQGQYGELSLNADGNYSYDLDNDAVQYLAIDDAPLIETFNYTITDADGDTSTTTLTVTINGTNDRPVITNVANDDGIIETAAAITEQTDDTAVIRTGGTISFTDTDVSDKPTISKIAAENIYVYDSGNTTFTNANPLKDAQKAALSSIFEAKNDAGSFEGNWSIDAAATVLDFLPEGETITIRYAVQVNDGENVTTAADGNELSTSEIRYVEVTITGTDDSIALVADTASTNEDTILSVTAANGIFKNDTADVDVNTELTVESYIIDGMTGTFDANVANSVIIDGVIIGKLTINTNGSYTFEPAANFSGTVPEITIKVNNGPNAATPESDIETLTITVDPVSDAPDIGNNIALSTDEDTTTATLGLKAPVITDATDLDGNSNTTDNPERIGLITLADIPDGATLNYGGNTYASTGADITILLSDYLTNDQIINNAGTPTITMTSAEFEAMTLTPPADDATNISFDMSVTEYEVDSSGNIIKVDNDGVVDPNGNDIAGATSKVTINIDVQAVTDSSGNNQIGDDFSTFGYDDTVAGVTGNAYTVSAKEGVSVDLPITTTFGDLEGNNRNRETYGFVITGLQPDAVVELVDANGNVIASSAPIDNNGSTTIGATANKDGSDNIILVDGLATVTGTDELVFDTSTGQPTIRITSADYNSQDMDNITVSLYTQDHDRDSDLDPNLPGNQRDATVELISTVTVDMTVTPVAGQVELDNTGVQTEEDTPVTLDTFGFTVLDKQDGAGTEVIDSIVFDIPVGWSYVDGVNSANNVTNAAAVTTITIDMTSSPDLSMFSIKPPAQSSTDTEFSFTVTTTDTDDDGGNTVTSTSESPLTQTVVVTPVAETVDTGVTINPDYTYTTDAAEDTAFNLDSDGTFNLLDNWSNPDDDTINFGEPGYTDNQTDSEETFALLTFGNKVDGINGEFSSVVGAVFTYTYENSAGTTVTETLIDNGNGVEIPAAYLNTVTVKPPQDYSDFDLDTGSSTVVKVQAKTIDYDEDGGASVTATSGESYLTFTVKGVADPITLGVDPALGFEDQALDNGNNRDGSSAAVINPTAGIPLSIRPSSRDNDGSEIYNVTITEIPVGAQLYAVDALGASTLVATSTVTDSATGKVTETATIDNYTNDVTSLYFVPAENYSGTVNLKVSAVSVESDGDTSDPTPALNLSIKIIGQADLILNDELGTKQATIVDSDGNSIAKDYTYVGVEDANNNNIALVEFFDDPTSIAAYDGDAPAAEQVTYKVTGLPEGFDITGAVFLGGSGETRSWSVSLESLQNGAAKLVTPDNFAGEVGFTITGTTTETISGNSVTHTPKDVSILITPDAADGVVNNPQVVAVEGEWTTIDFNAAFKTTDASAGDEVLDTITLNSADLENVLLLVNGVAPAAGNYTFNASDKIEVKYNSANEHSDASIDIEFDYTYLDTVSLADNATISKTKTDTATVNVTFQAVTDTPTISVNVTDNSINNNGTDDTASAIITISSPDQDGSESFTRLEVRDVPDGIIVQGGILAGNTWYIDVSDTAITDSAPEYTLVLARNPNTNDIPEDTFNVTVVGVTQDINGEGVNGSEDTVVGIFPITLTRDGNGGDPETVELIDTLNATPAPQSEEATVKIDGSQVRGFLLSDLIKAELSNADVVSAYSFLLTDLPEGTVLSSNNPNVNVQQIAGQWVISVEDSANLTPNQALGNVILTPPENFSTNEANVGQELSFNVEFTALNDQGLEDNLRIDDVKVEIIPVTDTFDNDGQTSAVSTDEDIEVDIVIDLTNSADGEYVSLIDGKLYIQINEVGLQTGTGGIGTLEYNGTKLTTDNNGDYVVDLNNGAGDLVNPPDSVTVQYTPAANAEGSTIITVNAAHKEVTNVPDTADGDVITYQHSYDVTVTAQPDELSIIESDTYNNADEDNDLSTVTATGEEDTLIAIPYQINTVDEGDEAAAIALDNVPDGYLVSYISGRDETNNNEPIFTLASNNGGGSNGNLWTIDATKIDTSFEDNIFIKAPENVSGTVTGIEVSVISDSGLVSAPLVVKLDVIPVADSIEFEPSTLVGSQGKWATLNLNAAMVDIDGSETVRIIVSGTNLYGDVLELTTSDGTALDVQWTAPSGTAPGFYVISGVPVESLNSLLVKSATSYIGPLAITLETVETANGDTFTTTPAGTIQIDVKPTLVFNGTDADDELISVNQTAAVNYSGGAGNDTFIGGSGNDTLNGDAGDDVLTGNAGNDTINGGAGNDTISGGAGNDILNGGTGNDTIDGGEGNDTIDGGTGSDTINAGAGNDTIVFDADDLLINGGDGNDTLLINVAGTTIDFGTFDSTKFESIETINLTGNGAQSLTNLSTSDVLDIISDTVMTDKDLIIKGDGGINGDSVTLTDEWISSGTRSQGGTSYNVYSFSDTNGTHDLLIQTDVNTTIL